MKLTIEIIPEQTKFQELYQTLQALHPTIRKEKGCRDCHIYKEMEDGEVFFLSVSWEEQANLVHYLRSNSGSALLGALDMLSKTCRVKIDGEEPWEGTESLKRMRKER